MKKNEIAITLGIMCCILAFLITIQLKTIKNAHITVGESLTENNLRDEVLRYKEQYDNSYREYRKKQEELEVQRQKAAQKDEASSNIEKELQINNKLLGLTDVSGQGLIVTIQDNQSVTLESIGALDNISYYLVHDEDIRIIINELKNAGAEAISINDQRIVQPTSITCDGNVILVNNIKLSSPFTIKAIGNSASLSGALLRPGGYIETLNSTGIITNVKKSENIKILKYDGVISSKYLKITE